VIRPQFPADESHSWHLDIIQGWGSETIFSLPPNNDERHPAGFDTSTHEKGHNATPAPAPASFAIFSTLLFECCRSPKSPVRAAFAFGPND
jgi:hypothetical protein